MATTSTLQLDIYNAEGAVIGQHELDARLFGVDLKEGLVHLAVIAQQANARVVCATTKTRGEVRGGGKKPWKQKGTGRARHGSIRSPLWRGGGVVFGPRPDRNFALKINKKAKIKALAMVLSDKFAKGDVVLVDALQIADGKTKNALATLRKLPIGVAQKDKDKSARVAVICPNGLAEARQGMRNLPFINAMGAQTLNVVELLHAQKLLIPVAGLEEMVKVYCK